MSPKYLLDEDSIPEEVYDFFIDNDKFNELKATHPEIVNDNTRKEIVNDIIKGINSYKIGADGSIELKTISERIHDYTHIYVPSDERSNIIKKYVKIN